MQMTTWFYNRRVGPLKAYISVHDKKPSLLMLWLLGSISDAPPNRTALFPEHGLDASYSFVCVSIHQQPSRWAAAISFPPHSHTPQAAEAEQGGKGCAEADREVV